MPLIFLCFLLFLTQHVIFKTLITEKIQRIDQNHNEFVGETRENFKKVGMALAEGNIKLQQLEMTTSKLNKTQVPVGFVYFELHNQPAPEKIWPAYQWEEISEKYSGLFFRTVGGAAAPFGVIQNSTCTRVTRVESTMDNQNYPKSIDLDIGQWSDFVETGRGETTSSSSVKTRFFTSNDQVTPKNQAIKIWKRIG